ncbi:MAG: TIGR04086 family membrane protein [Clostridiaceae bacterium]|nr:TIGR04086 family membrane protein [Clostridiaceae bacterium]
MKGNLINKRSGGGFNIWIYGKGLMRGYLLSLVLFLIGALLITYTGLSETILPIITSGIMVLSIAYASIYAAIHTKKRGWLHGAFIGMIYIVILIILSKLFITDYTITAAVYYRIITSVVTGVIGGMIGINIK